MAASYKELCRRCKKNYVLVTWRDRFPICIECQKAEMEGEITDPKMKKMFDIPKEFYDRVNFLRSIKINYLKYGALSKKQIDTFKKVVAEMKKESVAKKPKQK